jgi:accessory gene regulator protein AgrB
MDDLTASCTIASAEYIRAMSFVSVLDSNRYILLVLHGIIAIRSQLDERQTHQIGIT